MKSERDSGFPMLESRKRLLWLAFFTVFLFCLLIIQFCKIQIVEGEIWQKKANAQHHLTIIEPFKRGVFYSNSSLKKGHPEIPLALIVDVPKFHLFIDPISIPFQKKKEISAKLSDILYLKSEDRKKVQLQFQRKSRSRKLIMWISREKRNEIENWWYQYARENKIARNAIYFVGDYRRSYPHGKLLGQVLHTVREDRDPKTHQHIPTGGLELAFNSYLQGKEGKRLLLRSPRNPLDNDGFLVSPQNGSDIYLTINHYLQAVAEEEIAKAVQNANAKAGWAIMMEPRTGEVLALAQYPFFDPSEYKKYFNDSKRLAHTSVKAITDPYEPGSTMKPLTLAICLKANEELKKLGKKPIFFPEEKVATSNGFFPGRSKPIKDTKLHTYLNMDMALQKSSNIYMARMIQRVIESLGEKWYRNTLKDIFGLGEKTGIELPSESVGLLPTPGKINKNGTLEWSTPTPFSISFGHNILVNSVQMLRGFAILANGGYDVRPTLIRKIVKTDSQGKEEILLDNTSSERIKTFARKIELPIVERVVRAMKYVTKAGGSAPRGDIPGYTEVGKTATSEKIVGGVYSKKDHISTFVGFAPLQNPRFVLLIAIDEPECKYIPGVGRNQFGGNCAAPAFAAIGLKTLEYMGVEPDDPYGYPLNDKRYDKNKADWVKESRALQEKYREWNG